MRRTSHGLGSIVLALAGFGGGSLAFGSDSAHALRFHGTGTAQQDRVRIPIDDNAPGPDASTPCDVGAGSFTIDFWLKGALADNPSANAGGDVEWLGFTWIDGNTIVDRDVYFGTDRDWGMSIAGGRVRFGVGRGDTGGWNENTIEGSVNVLDGQWHHVACVRDVGAGQPRIYVDGVLDFQGSVNVNKADLSFPNGGAPAQVTPWGPYIVLGAEKHDAGPEYPSFRGYLDELRVWNRALAAQDVLAVRARVLAPGGPMASGLVGAYRFEEGAGTSVSGGVAGAPAGQVIAGVPGNGEWVSRAISPGNVAPVSACDGLDFNNDGIENDPADIEAFMSVYSGGPCLPSAQACNDIDFNNDGIEQDPSDIESFLSVYSGGPCL